MRHLTRAMPGLRIPSVAHCEPQAFAWSKGLGQSLPRMLSAGLLGASLLGCATVHPYQRSQLASPEMTPDFGDRDLTDQYQAKSLESRTATGLPGSAPGGGCGCSQ